MLTPTVVPFASSALCALLALADPTTPAPEAAAPTPAPAPPTLTLAQAEAEALRNQPTLRQARGQTEAAEGRVDQARAGYLPQVTVTAQYQRTTANFAARPGTNPTAVLAAGSWNTNTLNFYQAGLSASQLIYDFNQTIDRTRAAGANRDAAQANENATAAQALLGVRRSYFQARAQRELVDVAAETVRNQEKHVSQTQAFVRTGLRPDIDLAQVRTALANAQVQLVGARNNYAVAVAQLNQAMGIPVEAPHTLTDSELPAIPGEDGSAAALAAQAEKARPELAVLDKQRQAQELTVSALRGGYGPSLSAVAQGTEVGLTLDRLVPNFFVGLSLNWPILQGGLTHGQIREASGTLTAIGAQVDALRLAIQVQVEQARLDVVAAKSSMTAAGEALTNAREQLRLAEARYTTGLGSAIELGDAQVAFSGAEAQEVQARYGLAAARAELITALGQTRAP